MLCTNLNMKIGMLATTQVQDKYVVSVTNQQVVAKMIRYGLTMVSRYAKNVIYSKTKVTIVNKDISRKTRREHASSKKGIQLLNSEVRKPRRKPYRRAKSGSSKNVFYMEA